jgi:hypothetical protein
LRSFSFLYCPARPHLSQPKRTIGLGYSKSRSDPPAINLLAPKRASGVYLQTGTVSNPRTLSRMQKRKTASKGGPSLGRVWWIGETSAPCLNYRSFALAHWSLALADASGKTKSEKH